MKNPAKQALRYPIMQHYKALGEHSVDEFPYPHWAEVFSVAVHKMATNAADSEEIEEIEEEDEDESKGEHGEDADDAEDSRAREETS